MAGRTRLQDRYQLGQVLGRGGMGVVYQARDTLMNRQVALKTILDIDNRTAMDLFYKEWGVQASIVHPNIVEIYDIGEFEEGGAVKPFFVMPLLPGLTLDQLIREGSPKLSVERSIGIIRQACRGLQAAHDHGLVHRDLKPSNIFVMEDDSVKIIDFGVAHLLGTGNKTSLKGTLSYMAPEQLEMKAPSALTDVFSLAVVCYQTLTRRLPFHGNSEYEITEAILRHVPLPISEINSSVNEAISSVVHKAMAKRPWHRFNSAREFAEALQKALHNQPLSFLDPEKIKPRIARATKAFGDGEYEFASEILFELEAEGHLDPAITLMRRQLDQAVRKSTIRQLLESARRFREAGEYGLALRKTQEALELDADDTDVLALKNQIEKEHREKQIDEWFLLARQHLDNQAFGQAREAIDSVLKLKPNNTQALQILTEVERLERETTRSREEKRKLYEAAQKSWQKGEVTASLTKLESLLSLERDRPDTDGDRGAAYQKFYQQVRSEHDSIKNAYDEARTYLRDNNFSAARSVCEQYLAKYPYHALFQALKVDLEEQERQKLSAFIAETDQRVDGEPDLDRRLSILEEALKAYPKETHFERAARIVREKRDLVNSIVDKARFFEEKGQLNEAFDQWQILRTIHPLYPGLEVEMERLTRRRDQQARTEAKVRWGEQVDRHLETGDYDRAVEICQNALAEFPNDASLLELEKLARKGKERSTEAMTLLNQGRELCDQGQFEPGLDLLRQARRLDEHSPVTRKLLVNYLVTRARQLVDSDWEGADKLLREVLKLDPDHSPAQSLRNQIADHKREESVSLSVVQARRLQAEGDMDAARAVVEKGLKSYPDEPRLKQLLRTIDRVRSSSTARGSAAVRDFEELKRIEGLISGDLDTATAARLVGQVRAIADRYPDEDGIQALALRLQGMLNSIRGTKAPEAVVRSPGSAGSQAAVHAPAHSGAMPPEAPTIVEDPAGQQPVAAPPARGAGTKSRATKPSSPQPSSPQPSSPRSSSPPLAARAAAWFSALGQRGAALLNTGAPAVKNKQQMLLLAGGAAMVVLGAVTGFLIWNGSREAPVSGAATILASLQADPPNATIWIGGEQCGVGRCDVELPPGTYEAHAQMPGYQAAVTSFEITGQETASKPVVFLLDPLPAVVRLTSDLESGQVLLDGAPAGEFEDGELELVGVSPGEHTLEVNDRGSKASITFEVRPGLAPLIREPIAASDLKVAVVGSLGGMARFYSDTQDAEVLLDGVPAGQVVSDGLELANLQEGLHEVKIGDGRDELTVSFNAGGVPTLAAFLKSDRNVGSLRIVADEDDATAYLNGEEYARRKTQRGRLLIFLYPRQYKVRVAKPGFGAVAEQVVEVRRGEETMVEFDLEPLPQTASLTIRNAPPGAEVLVGGERVGTIPAGAETATFTLPPGRHTVSIRKAAYKPGEWEVQLKPGESAERNGALESATGTLQITLEPAGINAQVTIRSDSEPDERPISGTTLPLAEGTYTVTARANGYQPYGATVRVSTGETRSVTLTLAREEKAVVTPTNLMGALAQNGWTADNKLLTRRGGDFVLTPQDPAPGVYQFTILLQSGRRLEWFTNYRDPRNYAVFQMDRDQFTRAEMINGRRSGAVEVAQGVNRNEFVTVSVEVYREAIIHRVFRNGEWILLDDWRAPGANFLRGRFGFHIPGRDQVALSSFTFTPFQR